MIVNLQLMNNQLYLHISTEQDWASHSFNLVLNQTSALHRGILSLFAFFQQVASLGTNIAI